MVSKLKRLSTEWEKIFASCTSDKGLITRKYRKLKKLNSPKFNDPMKKWPEELNRTFSKEEIKMTKKKKHMKKCSIFLVIKEMKIKTMLRFHLTLVRMATIKNTNKNKCWPGCEEKRTLIHCWWECRFVQPLWRTVWRLLKTLEIELLYDLVIPLLGKYLKESRSGYNKSACTPMFIADYLQ
jgi:hypothetical protein